MNALSQYNTAQQLQYPTSAPKAQSSASFMAPSKSNEVKARETATEFESFFIYQMLELTDPGSPEGFDGGPGEEAFRRVLHEKMADDIAQGGRSGIGLADTIYDQIIKIQENNQ